MRKISFFPIFMFLLFIFLTGLVSFSLYYVFSSKSIGVLFFLVANIFIYRSLAFFYPATKNGYDETDRLLAYDIHTLYDVMFVDATLLTPQWYPYPVARLLYKCFGTKLGENSYPGLAKLSFPRHFITVGDNVIFGAGSIISAHVYESGSKLTLKPVRIGNNVTIGMNSSILPGTIIEDGAIVAAGAVVKKETYIKKGEIWGGVPARKLRDAEEPKIS